MRFLKAVFLIASFFPVSAFGEGLDASWLRTKTLANALNPNISVIGDMTVNTGPMRDAQSNRMSLRETEIGLQASVDPYARADFFVSFPEAENPELEEGYVSLLSLPWNLRARGGKFRPNFGKLNMIHPHEMPQVDAPLVISGFLGDEGLNDTGAEVSRIFAPMGVFTELSYAVLNGLGAAPEREPATTTVVDTNGNTVTVTVNRDEPAAERTIQNFAQIARLRIFKDLSDSANLDLGISGLLHQPKLARETRMGGIDLTLRWKPLQEGQYRAFIWRTEALYSDRKLAPATDHVTQIVTPEQRMHRRGIYSYAEYQWSRRWKAGLRGDYAESPEIADETITLQDRTTRMVDVSITRAVTPYVTFTLSEFNRFRLQYQNRVVPGDDTEHSLFFQWTVVLGPHGAHAF